MGVKLGVTGTRDGFSTSQLAWAEKHAYEYAGCVDEFHYGDCVGVDEAMLWAVLEWNLPALHIYPALVDEKWRAHTFDKLRNYKNVINVYKPLPPKVRNGHIAAGCDELWAFPGSGGGTWDCVRKAQKMGRFGFIVYRDGEVKSL